ncbi:MAG: hypothetical protein LQ338_002598 [Usnochroma carphineum]|nr:MAG: hypothetical protein LQ338_002598 [Usnochroma carphineum]
MAPDFYLGRRLSYSDNLCTVRYSGPVKGKDGLWVGVEWDDPMRASFVRPSKPWDPPIAFLDAIKTKYGSNEHYENALITDLEEIIGGAIVHEVGFEGITRRQSAWSQLKVISLDGSRINGITSKPWLSESRGIAWQKLRVMSFQCEELDLSRNLIETWYHVVDICSALLELRILKLKFRNLRSDAGDLYDPLVAVQELSLSNTALEWDDILQTPLSASHPESRLLTIARLPQLSTLNNTTILPRDRQNAELYYQNMIANLLLEASTPEQESQIHHEHPQWQYLCAKHGEPESIREKNRKDNETAANLTQETGTEVQQERTEFPRMSLAAHLCTFTFYTPSNSSVPSTPSTIQPQLETQTQTHTLPLPLIISVYTLKGIVARLLSTPIPALSLRLILETDEWDPVPAAKPADNDWSCSEGESSSTDSEHGTENGRGIKEKKRQEREERRKKLWVKREIEIPDSVRKVEDWVGRGVREARVRVERREVGEGMVWDR